MSQGANESANTRRFEFEFEFGEAFPAGDPIARFVVVLGMVSNDWHRLSLLMLEIGSEPDEEQRAVRMMLMRHSAATHFEARSFIATTRRNFPEEVEPFVAGLNAEAHEQLAIIDTPLPWLEPHRNVTFHYPEMHPAAYVANDEEIGAAMQAAATKRSSITVGTFGRVRFAMSDLTSIALTIGDPCDKERMREIVRPLSAASIALGVFAQLVFDAYYGMHKQRFGAPKEIT